MAEIVVVNLVLRWKHVLRRQDAKEQGAPDYTTVLYNTVLRLFTEFLLPCLWCLLGSRVTSRSGESGIDCFLKHFPTNIKHTIKTKGSPTRHKYFRIWTNFLNRNIFAQVEILQFLFLSFANFHWLSIEMIRLGILITVFLCLARTLVVQHKLEILNLEFYTLSDKLSNIHCVNIESGSRLANILK